MKKNEDRKVFHEKNTTLIQGQKQASAVNVGDWKTLISDKSLSQRERYIKVQTIAKKLEDKALRKEHIIRRHSLRSASQNNIAL